LDDSTVEKVTGWPVEEERTPRAARQPERDRWIAVRSL